jgi:ATP-dependent RNA helicase DDX3X
MLQRGTNKREGRRAAQAAKVNAREEGEAAHFWREVAHWRGRKLPWTPKELSAEEERLFSRQGTAGINFDQYDAIPVERSDAGALVAQPLDGFARLSACLPPFLAANIQRMGYQRPTPIQRHAVPLALAGMDLMCCAQTGSGKTMAFLLPAVARLSTSPVKPGRPGLRPGTALPRALALAPTRELASQIALEGEKLCFSSPFPVVAVYGGAAAKPQLSQLARGCALLVATPGRLTDFLKRGLVSLSATEVLVLDEADRMLDMGFEPQIRDIVQKGDMAGKASRLTMMFSATFPPPIQRLASEFQRAYVWVGVGRVGSSVGAIEQRLLLASEGKREKLALLLTCLGAPPGRTLVFTSKKRTASWIVRQLAREAGIVAMDIHGDRSQAQREAALVAFRTGAVKLLVATDVAARGLDIAEVAHVINFDMPTAADDFDSYVHRIGRTGRAGHRGVATSFYVPGYQPKSGNGHIAPRLLTMLREAEAPVPEWFSALPEVAGGSRGAPGGAGDGRAFKDARQPPQQPLAQPAQGQGSERGASRRVVTPVKHDAHDQPPQQQQWPNGERREPGNKVPLQAFDSLPEDAPPPGFAPVPQHDQAHLAERNAVTQRLSANMPKHKAKIGPQDRSNDHNRGRRNRDLQRGLVVSSPTHQVDQQVSTPIVSNESASAQLNRSRANGVSASSQGWNGKQRIIVVPVPLPQEKHVVSVPPPSAEAEGQSRPRGSGRRRRGRGRGRGVAGPVTVAP